MLQSWGCKESDMIQQVKKDPTTSPPQLCLTHIPPELVWQPPLTLPPKMEHAGQGKERSPPKSLWSKSPLIPTTSKINTHIPGLSPTSLLCSHQETDISLNTVRLASPSSILDILVGMPVTTSVY